MAAIFWVMGLSLLLQDCLCSVEQAGCMIWTSKGEDICCESCSPGYRLFHECGRDLTDLCTACKAGTYSEGLKAERCLPCTQCTGAQVLVKQCTTTTDTQCGCKQGLTCGDDRCSFCITKCGKGQEPTEKRSCRKCPDGTFNDQIHQKCKPWSTRCPHPDQNIVAKGDAFTDIKCANVSLVPVRNPKKPASDPTEQTWSVALFVVVSVVVLTAFGVGIIVVITMKVVQKRKDERKKPIVTTPRISTDDPRTLIAIECSFHEAQQEQGSSSESLDSKDSSDHLIA